MNKSIFTTLALFNSNNYDPDGIGMERVVYRTTNATTSGNAQYIRVRVKAR